MAKMLPTLTVAGLAILLSAPVMAQPKSAAPAAAPAAGAPVAPPIPPMSGMPQPPSIERVFEMLDTDHDGVVAVAEALKGVGEHFDAVDQNKDGTLEKAEFDSWFGRANQEASRFFLTLYDLDGDGKVTRTEFENPVKKRFALFDRNDDGKVTPEELGFARILMMGGPAGMLVPPMAPSGEAAVEPPPAMRGAQPIAPAMPPQMGQGISPYASAPGPQYMPQSSLPAPGVYGPGGQIWNQPIAPTGPGGQSIPGYQGVGRPLMMPQPIR